MSEKFELEMPPIIGLGNDYSFIETLHHNVWEKENAPAPNLKVSIVIPVYNRKEILAKTLAGIVHQTYPLELIEVIIADDGSKDSPEELIPLFENFFSIKHVYQKDDGYRLSAVRNLGIAAATYEHIIILDCDMLPVPTLVEAYMKWLHISQKVIVIGYRKFVCSDELSIEELIDDIRPALLLPDVNSENVDPKNFKPTNFISKNVSECIIPPNSFVLARTVEKFKIPNDVLVICLGKSTYARCGIIVNVTPLEPGWEGHVTLEFSNTTPLPAKIYANEGVAQFIFLKGNEVPEVTYADRKGKYMGQKGVTLPKV